MHFKFHRAGDSADGRCLLRGASRKSGEIMLLYDLLKKDIWQAESSKVREGELILILKRVDYK